ncbi:hypothetical protein SAMN02745111_02145 [Eubacterium uniforme]|uniref:DUF4375 domain-containing protein n=1 Tax=Eubacterium uniforme TaxID=39495 RepID=A0A1T4W1X1_9FIRM|nr:hypothetical protein [Eubacterium uniforme]SKA71048.1 hypothetical protein SAMN02745111_02145 [Eubacterium uniforme]
MKVKSIIKKGIEVSNDDFYLIEPELFLELNNVKDKPDFVTVFIELSSWKGTSLRSGVWTYYEATHKDQVEAVIKYLQKYSLGEEICRMYSLGNHDYCDEKYQDVFEYPKEWIKESEIIDKWIFENEENIIAYMQEIVRKNRVYFEQLFQD